MDGGGRRWVVVGGRWVVWRWWALVVWWVGGPVMSARLRLKAQGSLLRVSGIEFTSKGVGKGCQCKWLKLNSHGSLRVESERKKIKRLLEGSWDLVSRAISYKYPNWG